MTEYFWTDGSALGQAEVGERGTERTDSALTYLRYRLAILDKIEESGIGVTDDGTIIHPEDY